MTDEREPTCPLSDGAIDAVIDKHNDGSGCWRWADIVKICRDVAALSAARQSSAPGAAITLTAEQRKTVIETAIGKVDVGKAVECTVCHLRKKPRGRSAPLEMAKSLCDHECDGYEREPGIGSLWPGETRIQFGYPSDTIEVEKRLCEATVDAVLAALAGEGKAS